MQSAIQTAFRIQLLQLKELSAIKFKKKKKENLNPHWTFSELFYQSLPTGKQNAN